MENNSVVPLNGLLLTAILFFISFSLFAQVGIGTTSPLATLDVRAINHNGAVSATDGVLVPRVNDLVTSGSQDGQLVYLIEDTGNFKKGLHYWDGGKWVSFVENGNSSIAETVVNPDAMIPGAPTAAISFPYNIYTPIPDPGSIVIPMVVSGVSGATAIVTIRFTITHAFDGDIEIYLTSPTGQVLRLTDDNGSSNDNYINTNFTDAAATNITAGSAPFTGDFKPQGGGSGNISTLGGFNGFNPNGTWNITVTDDDSVISGGLNSFTLRISGSTPSNWIAIGEVAMDYFDDSAIIVQSTYSGDPSDLNGVKTALTRSTSTVVAGTSAASLPGTILNYSSASPSIIGNAWVNTFNQARNVGLTNNTTYYYQLWRQGNIEAPIASNETFSIIPIRIPQ